MVTDDGQPARSGFAAIEPVRGIRKRVSDRNCGNADRGSEAQDKPYGLFFDQVTAGTTTARVAASGLHGHPLVVYRVPMDVRMS